MIDFVAQNETKILSYINEMNLFVGINTTVKDFVVPRCCYYEFHGWNKKCIAMPFNPKYVFILIPNDCGNEINNRRISIEDPEVVNMLNQAAVKNEFIYNMDFVASASRDSLEELKLYIKDNQSYLEKLRSCRFD